ncbi:hypothetical protein SAMN05444392_12117 [Seinonella peptonophila]|uniref:Uncharacterized protein n=1 Tax=Seinonella peptonophila TaxID=112248 RepID=A0A1M5BD77_9BACL|nr:hypothetical protein [Seinonella peptonophila]SHF40277.1 hypothetical protein SAMN05444392_12117 [Seinonella peptonophila]
MKMGLCRCCRRKIILRKKRRRRRRIVRALKKGSSATVDNAARIDGPVSGLINIIVQVPVNLGDATSLNESDQNSLSNAL